MHLIYGFIAVAVGIGVAIGALVLIVSVVARVLGAGG